MKWQEYKNLLEFLENLECGAAKSDAQTVMENVWKKLVYSKEKHPEFGQPEEDGTCEARRIRW